MVTARGTRKQRGGAQKRYPVNPAAVARSPFRTTARLREAERGLSTGKSIGFTATASLKSMGRIPRANGTYTIGNKYKNLIK